MKRWIIPWLICSLCSATTLKMDLKEAIAIALSNNQGIKEARNSLELAKLNLSSAKKEHLPKIGLESGAQRLKDIPSSLTTDRFEASLDLSKSWLLSSSRISSRLDYSLTRLSDKDPLTPSFSTGPRLTLNWRKPLSKGGGIKENLSLIEAKENYEIRKIEYTLSSQRLILSVIVAYFQLFLVKETRKQATEQVEFSEKLLEWTKERLKAGQIPELDVMNVEMRLAQDRENLIQAEENEEKAKRDFIRLIGLEEGIEVELTEEFASISGDKESLEKDIEAAIANRKEIEIAQVGLNRARRNILFSQALNKPLLTIDTSYYWEGKGESLEKSIEKTKDKNWAIRCQLSFPFFDSGATANQVKMAQLNYKIAEDSLNKLKKDIADEVYEAYQAFKTSLRRIEALTLNLKMAEEVLQITKLKYEMGLVALSELLSVKIAYSETKRALLSARVDSFIQRAKLSFVCGGIERYAP